MNMFSGVDVNTPAGITKRKSRSKSRTRLSTVTERRDALAGRTSFGGIPVNQVGGGGPPTNNKIGFLTPRGERDDNTNNSILYPDDDAGETPGEDFDAHKLGFGFGFGNNKPTTPKVPPKREPRIPKLPPAPPGEPPGEESSSSDSDNSRDKRYKKEREEYEKKKKDLDDLRSSMMHRGRAPYVNTNMLLYQNGP